MEIDIRPTSPRPYWIDADSVHLDQHRQLKALCYHLNLTYKLALGAMMPGVDIYQRYYKLNWHELGIWIAKIMPFHGAWIPDNQVDSKIHDLYEQGIDRFHFCTCPPNITWHLYEKFPGRENHKLFRFASHENAVLFKLMQ